MLDLSDEFHEFTPIILATRLAELKKFFNASSAFSRKIHGTSKRTNNVN